LPAPEQARLSEKAMRHGSSPVMDIFRIQDDQIAKVKAMF
jgi:hypothetical protein